MSVAIEVARHAARPAIGPWSPLRNPVFRMMWFAALLSNVGTWMHEMAEAWLMTTTTPSPLLVALLETASSAPLFLLALPAGALGDIVDRRKLLLATQTWMLLAATGLGVSTLLGWSTPGVLLVFAFAIGVGAAVNAPVWQAIAPELVTTEELPAAIALSGIAINVARAIGPAVGGVLLSVAGAAVVFLLNAASFVVVVVALLRWKRSVRPSVVPAESMFGAIRAGARYVRHAPALAIGSLPRTRRHRRRRGTGLGQSGSRPESPAKVPCSSSSSTRSPRSARSSSSNPSTSSLPSAGAMAHGNGASTATRESRRDSSRRSPSSRGRNISASTNGSRWPIA